MSEPERMARLLAHQIAAAAHFAIGHSGRLPEDFTAEEIHPLALKRLLSASKHIHLSQIAALAAATGCQINLTLTEPRTPEIDAVAPTQKQERD